MAESTMTAILGRMAVYSGEVVEWDAALADDRSTMPEGLTMDSKLPVSGTPTPSNYAIDPTRRKKLEERTKGKGGRR